MKEVIAFANGYIKNNHHPQNINKWKVFDKQNKKEIISVGCCVLCGYSLITNIT